MPLSAVPPVALDEEQLVQRLVARDEQALRLVYEQYAQSLLAVIQRLVRDEALAQDILQEGLLKVWFSIASYDADRGRLFTWMARVCSHQAIDALRSPRNSFHRRSWSLQVDSAQRMPATATFHPEHIGLRELTDCLKPRQRELVDLLYFKGYTQVEAAQHLDIPLGTVKTRSRAALQVLAKFTRES